MRLGWRAHASRGLVLAGTFVGVLACEEKGHEPVAKQESVTLVRPPPLPPPSLFHVIARSKRPVHVVPGAQESLVESASLFYTMGRDRLQQRPELERGLSPAHWYTAQRVYGRWPDATYWEGTKSDPARPSDQSPVLHRMRFPNAWGKFPGLFGGDTLAAVARWKGDRFVALIVPEAGKDYRVYRTAGKAGLPLPKPTRPGPEAEGEADDCKVRVLPRAAEGTAEGTLVSVGNDCWDPSRVLVERWTATSLQSVVEPLPSGAKADARYVVAPISDKAQYVAMLGSDYLAFFDGKVWSKQEALGKPLRHFAANAEQVWAVTDDGLFRHLAGKWRNSPLDAGVEALSVVLHGSSQYVLARQGEEYLLLSIAGAVKEYTLADPYVVKTPHAELPNASDACSDLFVLLRSGVAPREALPDVRDAVAGKFAGASFMLAGWGKGLVLGATPKDFEQGQRLAQAVRGARLTCYAARVYRALPW